jgi:hypothetical protein
MSTSSINAYYKYIDSSIKSNKSFPNNLRDGFSSNIIPEITILDYIKRLFNNILIRYENIEGVILHSIAFLNLLKNIMIYLTEYNCHRLILLSLMLASKIYEDIPQFNLSWAIRGGVTLNNLNIMEVHVLNILKFDVNISPQKLLAIHKCIY